MSIRLNKLLAERGLGARRKCDALIAEGVVRLNGVVVTEPGIQIDPQRDVVMVRGRPLPRAAAHAYYVLHKPVGVISTLSDPEGRRSLAEFMPPGARLYPVGRLDADTSGLLLITNDGELAHHLMHPRYGVSKAYRVHVDRAPSPAMMQRLADGIEFEPGIVSAPARVRVLDETPGDSVIEIAIHEGRYRQVRRMCEAAGLHVQRLHRWAYGPLRLGELARGMWRELSESEVASLRATSARPRARGEHVPPRPARRRGRGPAPRAEQTSFANPRRGEPGGRGERSGRSERRDPRVATGGRPGDRRPSRRPFDAQGPSRPARRRRPGDTVAPTPPRGLDRRGRDVRRSREEAGREAKRVAWMGGRTSGRADAHRRDARSRSGAAPQRGGRDAMRGPRAGAPMRGPRAGGAKGPGAARRKGRFGQLTATPSRGGSVRRFPGEVPGFGGRKDRRGPVSRQGRVSSRGSDGPPISRGPAGGTPRTSGGAPRPGRGQSPRRAGRFGPKSGGRRG